MRVYGFCFITQLFVNLSILYFFFFIVWVDCSKRTLPAHFVLWIYFENYFLRFVFSHFFFNSCLVCFCACVREQIFFRFFFVRTQRELFLHSAFFCITFIAFFLFSSFSFCHSFYFSISCLPFLIFLFLFSLSLSLFFSSLPSLHAFIIFPFRVVSLLFLPRSFLRSSS